MKTAHNHFSSTLILFGLLAQLNLAFAGGTVTTPTEAALKAALAGGGTVTFACNGTVTLSQTLNITQDTTIDANGYEVTLSGGNAVRLFAVTNAVLRVSGLTLANGYVLGAKGADGSYINGILTPSGPGQDGAGACILNRGGSVSLSECTLIHHQVRGGDAGAVATLTSVPAANGGSALGGALCSWGGQLNLTNCLVTGCAVIGGAGGNLSSPYPGVYGVSGVGLGGAVYLAGSALNLQNVTLTNNHATGGPGGMNTYVYWSANGAHACGGAVYATNSSLCAGDSVLMGNAATGGAVVNADHGTTSGDGSGGALFVTASALATLTRCTLAGNSASSSDPGWRGTGGSGRGGAVFNGGTLQVYSSTCSSNSALATTGSFGARVGQGGALYSTNSAVLVGCTFNNNLAQGGDNYSYGSSSTPGEGGAVWSAGGLSATNCTWATNQAVAGYYVAAGGTPAAPSGGGVCITGGSAALVNMTLAGNRAAPNYSAPPPAQYQPPLQGGSLFNATGQVLVQNSIFVNGQNPGGTNFWGTITDGGYNLSSDTTGGFTASSSRMNIDPMLASLASYGGPTVTLWLLPGSPARDQIPSGYPATDQRGAPRPQGPATDIGAVEADNSPAPTFKLLSDCSANQLTLTLPADCWRAYRLLCSTDMVTWAAVATNSPAASGLLQFTPPMTAPKAFYRVVTP